MSIKVAIVEDNDSLRLGLTQLLSLSPELSFVGSYNSAEAFMTAIDSIVPDVVLMDIDLPNMSGIACVKKARAIMPVINIIMLTVFEEESRIMEAIANGASGYLLKHTPPARILESIYEVHAGGSPMTASVARQIIVFLQQKDIVKTNLFKLSERELKILQNLVEGFSYKMIATQNFISIDTVRSHIRHIYEKMQVHSKSEAVVKAIQQKMV